MLFLIQIYTLRCIYFKLKDETQITKKNFMAMILAEYNENKTTFMSNDLNVLDDLFIQVIYDIEEKIDFIHTPFLKLHNLFNVRFCYYKKYAQWKEQLHGLDFDKIATEHGDEEIQILFEKQIKTLDKICQYIEDFYIKELNKIEIWSRKLLCLKNPKYMYGTTEKSTNDQKSELDFKIEIWSRKLLCLKNPKYMYGTTEKSTNDQKSELDFKMDHIYKKLVFMKG